MALVKDFISKFTGKKKQTGIKVNDIHSFFISIWVNWVEDQYA